MRAIYIPPEKRHKAIQVGSFSTIKKHGTNYTPYKWLFCREYFHTDSRRKRKFLYICENDKAANIAGFIGRIEDKLGLGDRCRFYPTQRCNMMWIRMSPWWAERNMRRNLFTALLRVGQMYDAEQDNWEECMFENSSEDATYLKNTEYAVRRFLAGFTKYTGWREGWYNAFFLGGGWSKDVKTPSQAEIRKLLVKP